MTIAGFITGAAVAFALSISPALASGSGDHTHDLDAPSDMLKTMQEMHADHDHEHDFEVMDDINEEHMHRTIDLLLDIGLVVPTMDSSRGADAFMETGCILCHRVNGIGGEVGPSFDAEDMPSPMNAFEFAARMWRGAPAMVQMQEDLLGDMISLNGQELADIVAFVHDQEVQSQITKDDIPAKFAKMLP